MTLHIYIVYIYVCMYFKAFDLRAIKVQMVLGTGAASTSAVIFLLDWVFEL